MFEEMTFDRLMDRMLEKVPSSLDKRQGSIIYDALSPAAMEMARLYIMLDEVLNEVFADTASLFYLKKRAAERGVYQRPATNAVVKGKFNITIPSDSVFSAGSYNYTSGELIDNDSSDGFFYYKLYCSTAGAAGNQSGATLIPVNYIEGLTVAEIMEILVPGEDDEDVEDFRLRYTNSFNVQSFGGNIEQYKEWVKNLSVTGGVNGVKVYPTKYGGGTVGIVFQAADGGAPSEEAVQEVQEAIDPGMQGSGTGIAPADHKVTVEAVTEKLIDLSLDITLRTGYQWEDVENPIKNEISIYFQQLNDAWENEEHGLIVRIAKIESAVLDVPGIEDITNAVIYADSSKVTGNYEAGVDDVLVLGDIERASSS